MHEVSSTELVPLEEKALPSVDSSHLSTNAVILHLAIRAESGILPRGPGLSPFLGAISFCLCPHGYLLLLSIPTGFPQTPLASAPALEHSAMAGRSVLPV